MPPVCHTFSNIFEGKHLFNCCILLAKTVRQERLFYVNVKVDVDEASTFFEVMASMMIMRLLYMSLRKLHRYIYILTCICVFMGLGACLTR